MRLVPLACESDVIHWVAEYIISSINNFRPTEENPYVLGLPTGSTPLKVYQYLIQAYKDQRISFRNVITFNMDEYVGLSKNNINSYYYFMHENFFKHIDIQLKNVNIPNGLADNLYQECIDYEDKIKKYGKINLFLGGVGVNGHIAFNEPGSSLQSKTRVKTLTHETIQSNARFFNNDENQVPNTALTVGIGTILNANEVLIIANGYNKSLAVSKAIEEGVNHCWPISSLQLHTNAIIVCDELACMDLKLRTVKYYQEVEQQRILLDKLHKNK